MRGAALPGADPAAAPSSLLKEKAAMHLTPHLTHTMLDTETLGTRADSVILSIGAVRFDPYGAALDPQPFYLSVSIDSNHEAGQRHLDEDTLLWWLNQSDQAQRVFHEPKTTLRCALEALADYLAPRGLDATQVWSFGADFDLPLLAHAYRSFGYEVPWQYRNTNCLRTITKLPALRDLALAGSNPDLHHAASDAVHQARRLQRCLRALSGADRVGCQVAEAA
jgi:hypothetical protein